MVFVTLTTNGVQHSIALKRQEDSPTLSLPCVYQMSKGRQGVTAGFQFLWVFFGVVQEGTVIGMTLSCPSYTQKVSFSLEWLYKRFNRDVQEGLLTDNSCLPTGVVSSWNRAVKRPTHLFVPYGSTELRSPTSHSASTASSLYIIPAPVKSLKKNRPNNPTNIRDVNDQEEWGM